MRTIFFLMLLLLVLPAQSADRGVGAAVVLRDSNAVLRFDDGTKEEEHISRRAGIEYLERVAAPLWVGFAAGYSEDEVEDATRAYQGVSGNYGALLLDVALPLNASWSLQGGAHYLVERDSEPMLAVRRLESFAELGPSLRLHYLELSAGVSWQRIDYRETATAPDGTDEYVRRGHGDSSAGAFARIALPLEPRGHIALRYDDGAETGWTLRFERTF